MAVQSKLAQAIRAIVGARDKRSEELALQAIRNSILGKRGIGYMFPDGLNAGGVSGSSGVTLLGTPFGNLSQFATNEQIEKIKKAEENAPKSITNVLNIHIGGKAMAIDGLEDCATGKDIEIVNTPQFKPPPGWTDANTPPEVAQFPILGVFEVGKSWSQISSVSCAIESLPRGATLYQALTTADQLQYLTGISSHPGGCVGSPVVVNLTDTPFGDLNVGYNSFGCTTGTDAFCPTTAPVIPWPVDNKMQLSRQANGKFIYSSNEPTADIIPAYTDNQHSRLDLCFNDGSGRKASVEATRDGGWIVYETLDGEGVGIATVFDSTNTAIDKINVEDKGEVTVSFE